MCPVTIVIPFYNNSGCIWPLMHELASIHKKERNYVLVDDASTDKTLLELSQFAPILPEGSFRIIRNEQNIGSHSAVRRAASMVNEGIVVVMAGDGQDDPAHVDALIAALDIGNDVALTASHTDDSGLYARIFHRAMCLLTPKVKELTDTRTWYMLAADAALFQTAGTTPERHLYYDLINRSRMVAALPVKRRDRTAGASQWGTMKKLRFAIGWLWAEAHP